MKAYAVYWRDDSLKKDDDENHGTTMVIADSVTRAISRFQREYDPRRVIESVYQECKEVLIEGADS
jgi:hypothetical protein